MRMALVAVGVVAGRATSRPPAHAEHLMLIGEVLLITATAQLFKTTRPQDMASDSGLMRIAKVLTA